MRHDATSPGRHVVTESEVDAGRKRFHEIAIVGGGCYGTFYTRQLLTAREKGKLDFTRLLVVDHDPACQATREVLPADDAVLVTQEWDDFFDHWLSPAPALLRQPGDVATWRSRDVAPSSIVPSPLMPHLMYTWLVRRARTRWPARRVETIPIPRAAGTPYDTAAPDGTRYLSYADWLCPTHCIEPALCPVTRAPRTWEMSDALDHLARELGAAGAVAFHCEHQAFGVGMFLADAVRGGAELVERLADGGPAEVVVGTVSSCHGAVNLLSLGPVD